jgi:huntingtin
MAEKLLKSLEALKSSSLAATAPLNGQEQNRYEKVLGEQEKISHMNAVAELICSVSVRTSPDFVRLLTASMESILLYCSDRNATVRLNANESLNRMIVGLKESAITRVLWELFKEIKRNARSRSLAAALSRFGELCHLIKASKCRSYVGHLLPSVGRALKRDDELVQETLAAAMVKICPVLAPYMAESELQTLIKSFLSKLHSSSAATRRTASSSLALLCQYAQKQNRTLELLLTGLLNAVSPRCGEENPSSSSVIGVLSCIRQLVPQLSRPVKEDQGIADSFNVELEDLTVKKSSPASSPVISRQIHQLYELVLRCSNHQNHNIVSASLEALHQILSSPSDNFAAFLISQREKLPKEESTESKQSDSSEQVQSIWDGSREGEPNLEIDEQTMGEFEEDSLIWADSTLKLCELDEEAGDGDGKLSHDVKELEHGESQEASALDNRGEQSVLKPDGESCQSIVGGSYYDSCHENENLVPLAHCILHVCSAFLLPASTGNLISDKVIRVSIKALAVRCVAAAVRLYPKCFLLQLKPKQLNSDDEGGPPQFISDVLLYVEHTDPLLRGEIAMLIGSLVLANLQERKLCFQSWESKVCDDYEPLQMGQLIGLLGKCLDDESTVSRMACSAVKLCLPTLLSSSNGNLGLKLLLKLSDLSKTSYWLVKVTFINLTQCMWCKMIFCSGGTGCCCQLHRL